MSNQICYTGNGEWSPDMEEILKNTLENLKHKIAGHTLGYKSMRMRHNWMSFFVHTLNVVAASSSFLVFGIVPDEHIKWVNLGTGCVVLASSLLTGIQNTLDYKKKFELHDIAITFYENIKNDVEMKVITDKNKRGDAKEYLTGIHKNTLLLDVAVPHITMEYERIKKYLPKGTIDKLLEELKDIGDNAKTYTV